MFRPGNIGHIGRLGLVAAMRNEFSPLSLFANGEQGVWYDPSDLSTLFQDSAGTIPVTAVEQPVGCMMDKCGRGNHATQSTGSARRILRVDANGKYYLAHTGSSTWMQTGIINLTGTDKISVFAGLRKYSDTGSIFCELSADLNSNPGSFFIETANKYNSMSRGTTASAVGQVASTPVFSGADLAVLSSTHNISGDLSTIRRNGSSGSNGVTDKGSGNFGNYPMYLFRRAGSLFQFTGDFYGLIFRGAMSDATQITNSERWLAAKTGVTF